MVRRTEKMRGHGGKAAVRRPRVRRRGGGEVQLSNWKAIQEADLLSRWAFNQMLIGVATRKYARSVRLPDGDLADQARRATTKSSVSRRFVALSTTKLEEWLAADLSGLDLLVIQIDGLHVGDHVLVTAIGIDGAGDKHVLALALGATENAAVVKALLADLIERGLQLDIARLFIVDGAKALSRAVRDTFGGFALITMSRSETIPRTASSRATTRAPTFFARNQSAALLMLASGPIVATSVPFCIKMFSTFIAVSLCVPAEMDAGFGVSAQSFYVRL